ncbi:MAG: Gfo/Idh/MocA family protein [Planctomycetota bacterium]|jgi:predicted dehydrogenase
MKYPSLSSLKILVVGCGSMGRRRIRHCRELLDAEVFIWDIREDRREEVRNMFSVNVITAQDEMLAFQSDILFICVPPSEHEYYINWAIAHGVSFMTEQPVSDKLDNLSLIRENVEKNQMITHVSSNHRFSGRVKAVKEIINSGELGRPLTGIVEIGEWLPDWHPYEPYTDYYPSNKAMGGGLDGVCDLDWLRYLFGEVTAKAGMGDTYSDLEIDTCDVAQFIFRFESNCQVILHTDFLQKEFSAALKFVFTEGQITHRMPDSYLSIYNDRSKNWNTVDFCAEKNNNPTMQGKESFDFVEPMYKGDTEYFFKKLSENIYDLESLDSGITNLELIYNLVRKQHVSN